jgi:uncharacterized protein YegP (UPF0339 family)
MVSPEFEISVDKDKQYRWRLRATNSKIIATSGEGYINFLDCDHAIDLVKKEAPIAGRRLA